MTELLRCDLQAFGIPTIVQAIQSQRLSARLVIASEGEDLGAADFAEGVPVSARCGPAEGRAAFLDLFTAPATGLRVLPVAIGPAPPLGDTLALVIEGCRLKDEWTRIGHGVWAPGDRAVPGAAEHPFVRQLRVGESLFAATRRLDVSRADIIDVARRLVDEGWLSLDAASDNETPPPLTFPELLDAGQRHYQRGDALRALEAFEAALQQRPDDFVALQNRARILELNPDLCTGGES